MVRQGGKSIVGIWVVLALLILPLAAYARQDGGVLEILSPVNGTLDASTPTATYTVSLDEGFIFSLRGWVESGNLQLEMTVSDAAGTVVAEGVPVDDTRTIIAAELLTMLPSEVYSVSLSAVSGTSGEYGLMLVPGYSFVETWDEFEGKDDDFSLTWDESTTPTETGRVDGQLRIVTDEPNTITWLSPDEEVSWSDLYVEADVVVDGTPSYFEYGLMVRVDDEAETFYVITVNSEDTWWASYFDGENWTTLQDWTESTVIDSSLDNPRLGLFVQGNVFTLYFNDELVGSFTDTEQWAADGTIALAGATTSEQTDTVTVYFDNLIITSPGLSSSGVVSDNPGGDNDSISGLFGSTSGDNATPTAQLPFGLQGTDKTPESIEPTPTLAPPAASPTPEATVTPKPTTIPLPPPPTPTPEAVSDAGASLTNWRADSPQAILNELVDLGLIPSGGALKIDVKNSFGDTSSTGFSYFPLAEGRSFQNFVLGFDAQLTLTGPGSGCGMHFRNNPDSRTMAYVMEDGSALLTQVNFGEFHEATIYDIFPSVNPGQNAVNRVLVIALEETVAMYVNGELIGVVDFNLETGGVALEVYVQADESGLGQRTYCQLQDVWLWEF